MVEVLTLSGREVFRSIDVRCCINFALKSGYRLTVLSAIREYDCVVSFEKN